jgi:hypothetical protein
VQVHLKKRPHDTHKVKRNIIAVLAIRENNTTWQRVAKKNQQIIAFQQHKQHEPL